MQTKATSIRPFIGAKDYNISRLFYHDIGFEETILEHNLSVFKKDGLAFYLQDYYTKDWVDNTMVFMEVEDVQATWDELVQLNLQVKYPGARISPIRYENWGSECFVHDPSGILWHYGQFSTVQTPLSNKY